MPNLLTWWEGDRDPSIQETVTIDGAPVDLTGASCRFKMRAVGSATLKVDAPVSNTPGPTGELRYDWAAGDLTPAGAYLVWWEVERSGKRQSVGEAVIQVLAHAPLDPAYIELEELKRTLSLDGLTFADRDLRAAILTASRQVEERTGRRFWRDATDRTRAYTPLRSDRVWIDDLDTLTELRTDADGDGVYETVWAASDYALGPANAPELGMPWTRIEVRPGGRYLFPLRRDSVQVTGRFGWGTTPTAIRSATQLLAHRLLRRVRESPHGVLGFGADGAAVRVLASDPDVEALLAPYLRGALVG